MSINKPEKIISPPLWQRITGYINIFILMFYTCLPGTVAAFEMVSNAFISTDVNANPQFQPSVNSQYLFEKVEYVADNISTSAQSIAAFHKKLLTYHKASLAPPIMVPIMNGDITIIFPHYPLAKQLGDGFVQSRFIRSQIYNQINRNLITDVYNDETSQISGLYSRAYDFAKQKNKLFGATLTANDIGTYAWDFVWPELRTINNQQVLVPIVHLTQATIDRLLVKGLTIEFRGDVVNLSSLTINAGTVYASRTTFLQIGNDLAINEGATLYSDDDLNVTVGGTLRINSGAIRAGNDLIINAGEYIQKTVLHRFNTSVSTGTRLGKIAEVTAGGNIILNTAGDITLKGATIEGNNIRFNAGGDILVTSIATTTVNGETIDGWDVNSSELTQIGSYIGAKNSIELIAAGAIEINASTLHAEQGTIDILAGQGVYILNADNELQSARSGKFGKNTIQEQEFQSIAVRSALNAGQGIVIATEFGDVNLKATKLTSTTGTEIRATNGAVNFLMTKEQETYFYNKVHEGTWKIKTTTIEDNVETAVYNQIIGGVKVQATHGLTIELAQYENGSTQQNGQDTESARISKQIQAVKANIAMAHNYGQTETPTLDAELALLSDELLRSQLNSLATADSSLAWMQDLHNDPQYTENFNIAYQELIELHKFDKTSTLSPAAMAIIAIAVAVAMGPAGLGAIGAGGAIGSVSLGPVLQAGLLSIANQAAVGLASGQGLEDTTKSLFHSDNIKATVTAMVTAGAMSQLQDSFKYFDSIPDGDFSTLNPNHQFQTITNQATQSVGNAVVRTGISTVINGGDLGDFEDAFIQSLQGEVINQLGKHMAETIADADLDTSLKYIAHASVGCVIGVASANLSSSSGSSGNNCATGAGGSVVGEFIGEITRENIEEKLVVVQSKLNKDIGFLEDGTLTVEDVKTHTNLMFNDLENMRAAGIDIAKLAAGLTAFIAGGNVNIASDTAQNSAENNALSTIGKIILKGGAKALVLLNIYDKVEKGYTIYGLGEALAEGDTQRASDILISLAEDGVIDLTISALIPQGQKLLKAVDKLRSEGKNNLADDLLHYAQAAPGGDLTGDLQPGKFSLESDVPGVTRNAWTEGVDEAKLFTGHTGKRDDLKNNFDKLDVDRTGKDAHHIIPWQLREHPLIAELKYDMNDLFNGVLLKRNSSNLTPADIIACDTCIHGTHPSYNSAMTEMLDELDMLNISLEKKSDALLELVQRARANLNSGTPPLMNKHGAQIDSWIEVLRPAIDKVKP